MFNYNKKIKQSRNLIYHTFYINKETGELMTYNQALKEFYSTKRNGLCSIFNYYIDSGIETNEKKQKVKINNIFN